MDDRDVAELESFYRSIRHGHSYEVELSTAFREQDGSFTIGASPTWPLGRFLHLDHYTASEDQSFSGTQAIIDSGRLVWSSFVTEACADNNPIRWRPYVEGGTVVWHNRYEGRIFPARPNQKVAVPDYQTKEEAAFLYERVLKPALRDFPADRPFQRGPKLFFGGHWPGQLVYRCTCTGDMSAFENKETIEHGVSGTIIYLYEDHGGLGPLSGELPGTRPARRNNPAHAIA